MQWTEEQLKQIEELAALAFSVKKLAIILGVDEAELRHAISDETGDVFKRYQRGRLLSESEWRKSVFTLAKQGSSPAQTLAKKLSDECEMENLR